MTVQNRCQINLSTESSLCGYLFFIFPYINCNFRIFLCVVTDFSFIPYEYIMRVCILFKYSILAGTHLKFNAQVLVCSSEVYL